MDTQNPNTSVEQNSAQTEQVSEVASLIKKDSNIDTDSIMNFIKDIFGKSLKTFQDPKLMTPLLMAGLVAWAIEFTPTALAFISLGLGLLLVPVSLVISVIFFFSLANIGLQAAKGNTPNTADATKPLSRIVNYLITYIKIFIQFIVKLFQPPFIIPGFKYAISASLFMLENLENNTPNEQAITKSQDYTKGNLLNLFCLSITITLVTIIGSLIPFSIATIVLAPFSGLVYAHAYLKLKK